MIIAGAAADQVQLVYDKFLCMRHWTEATLGYCPGTGLLILVWRCLFPYLL